MELNKFKNDISGKVKTISELTIVNKTISEKNELCEQLMLQKDISIDRINKEHEDDKKRIIELFQQVTDLEMQNRSQVSSMMSTKEERDNLSLDKRISQDKIQKYETLIENYEKMMVKFKSELKNGKKEKN